MSDAQSIQKLLVPLDGSETGERALPWARAVAGDHASIVLLEVMPVAMAVRSIGGQIIGDAETIQAGYRQIAEDQLNDAVAKWLPEQQNVSTEIAVGDPAEQIIDAALAQNAGLVVMSSHGRGAIGRFVSGSVADRVVRHAPVPVMIVGPEGDIPADAEVKRIIAPVEDSELSLAALPIVSRLARTTGAPVTLLHVIVPETDMAMIYPTMAGTIPPSAYEAEFERLSVEARELIDRAVGILQDAGVEAQGQVYSGQPATSIMA
ncbi:MAG: universal stress protein, partial [Thermomicrobiales bacterium]|nr:universal stress protein [Thermomicrobiales bacterium]